MDVLTCFVGSVSGIGFIIAGASIIGLARRVSDLETNLAQLLKLSNEQATNVQGLANVVLSISRRPA